MDISVLFKAVVIIPTIYYLNQRDLKSFSKSLMPQIFGLKDKSRTSKAFFSFVVTRLQSSTLLRWGFSIWEERSEVLPFDQALNIIVGCKFHFSPFLCR